MMTTQNKALLLVAEDDPDDQYFLQEAIEVVCAERVKTHFVFDGAQLMNFLREKGVDKKQPNLVVLDLNMKVKDGRKSLLDIKTDPAFTNIPVVVLTTSDNEEDMEYCKQHGAAEYYQKPSSIMELVKIIRTLCTDYLS
ncbi:MAG: response regulator [Syntrophothermus sp.]